MLEFTDRLNAALAHAQKRPQDLWGHLGVSRQAIKKYEAGSSKSMTAENCAKTSRFLGVSWYWLATGEGDMLEGLSSTTEKSETFVNKPEFSRNEKLANAVHEIANLLIDANDIDRALSAQLLSSLALNPTSSAVILRRLGLILGDVDESEIAKTEGELACPPMPPNTEVHQGDLTITEPFRHVPDAEAQGHQRQQRKVKAK